ncbi:flavin reductase family protein [Streptomyces minutiscleroticus]|uniref:Flavin reductase n=1 Tax=Streptomyces minutiscleroticus TaxID=68238 RepID=A0A918KF48_9ACTN|nr:flavin reductase family protein [Streptomyces minutiscleroticus]GGX60520.1 flavin reductase [Streptomyces minutiscleroticus]
MAVDPATFRRALSHVPTSISVVAAFGARDRPYGVTVGSLCSLSLAPPLVLFCLGHRGTAHRVVTAAHRFGVHVLTADQQPLARRFAAPGEDRTAGLVRGERHGVPMVPDALASLVCSRYAVVPAGDHSVVIGLVERADVGEGSPLLYYDRSYRTLFAPDAHPSLRA